jgi:hypothetical protein
MGTVYPPSFDAFEFRLDIGYTVSVVSDTPYPRQQKMESVMSQLLEGSIITQPGRRRELHDAAPAGRDWQRRALFTGGVAFAVGNLLHPLQHNDVAYRSSTWEAAHLTIFFSLPLLVLGLPVVHRLLTARIGTRLSAVAVAASVVGLIGIAPGTILEAFVAPLIGHAAMQELESGGLGAVNAIMGGAYLGGTIALGWALHRARLRPRWAGPSLIASAVVLLGVMTSTSAAAGVVIITATAVYGAALSVVAVRAQ